MNKKKTGRDVEEIVFNGKLPPQDLMMEEVLLGSCMLEKNATSKVAAMIKPEYFYSDANKLICETILELYDKNIPIDITIVASELRKKGRLEEAGGAWYVTQLTNKVASSANIEEYASRIKVLAVQRRLINILAKAAMEAWGDTIDLGTFVSTLQLDLDNLKTVETAKVARMDEVVDKMMERIDRTINGEEPDVGIPSSIPELTEKTLGYVAPEVTIIGGAPGEGKTTLALQDAYNAALNGQAALYVCMEMKDYQLALKLLSAEVSIETTEIRKGNFTNDDYLNICKAAQDMRNVPLYICDASNLNMLHVKAIARELYRIAQLKIVFIDYLQIVKGSDKHYQNREAEVSHISRQIKELAMELDIPVVPLSQVSRPEKGSNRLYRLTDLRESGAIEANADNVVFVFRPEYHGITHIENFDESFVEDDMVPIIAKARNGKTGMFRCRAELKYNRIVSLKKKYMESKKQPIIDFGTNDATLFIEPPF